MIIFLLLCLPLLLLYLFMPALRLRRFSLRNRLKTQLGITSGDSPTKICAFFHPYCHAGGGGERVLWTAIRALQLTRPNHIYVVYTGDTQASGPEILSKAESVFGITLPKPVHFVHLSWRGAVEARYYPRFTLILQSLGSIALGVEALFRCPPDIFVDSMGYAFTLPLFRYLGGCRVAAYVHYPTISTDMIQFVDTRAMGFNNAAFIAGNAFLTRAKLAYYRWFAWLYGTVGRSCDVVMVNSSWTEGHINALWKAPQRTFVVYPPCNTTDLQPLLADGDKSKKQWILSVGQFRPEKNHPLQLESFARFLSVLPTSNECRLVVVGGCRNAEDEARVCALRELASKLGVEERVDFRVNVSYAELKEIYASSLVGLHTMTNEHFGIGVVECMAAGLITVAHNSGGPRLDIVTSETGFLAATVDEYAECFRRAFALQPEERTRLRELAAQRCDTFSEANFERCFLDAIRPLVD